MKIRNGFVSNSSSTSFVCDVCGDRFESWDEGIAHFNLVMCEDHDHLFCGDHRINPNNDGTYTMIDYEDEDRISSRHCPICQLQAITQDMIVGYALRKLKTNLINIKNEMQVLFKDYDELNSFITSGGDIYGIELTAQVRIKAPNKEFAYKEARRLIAENPLMLDVTHCEEL